MYLYCCHRRLSVQVVHDLRDQHGRPCDGLFRTPNLILLDSSLPRDRRRETLVHELGHAYEYFVGRIDPNDVEGRQNRLATIDSQLLSDLDDQAGEETLHALYGDADVIDTDDDEAVVGWDDAESDFPTRISCPCCHQSHSSGRVRNGTPAFNPRLNCFVIWRLLQCRECGRELRWQQKCTYEGMPLPDVVVQPQVRTLAMVD